jgi:RND family efflux transporter MFP subunit
VPQGEVASIRRGMPAKLTLQDLPGRSFEGSVARYSNSLDLGTRTMLTEIDLKNPRHELYPGMYANVTLELERHPDALKVPESAVGDSQDGKYVMIARDGKLRKQSVTIGINTGKSAEIVRGLGGGEMVVANLDPSIVTGEAVNAVQQKPEPGERPNMVAETQ